MVVATQNPIEYEGTYPLPEAQLDRFLLKLTVPLPGRDDEIAVLARHHGGFDPRDLAAAGVTRRGRQGRAGGRPRGRGRGVASRPRCSRTSSTCAGRPAASPSLSLGASPRGATAMLNTAKAWAWLSGRDFVTPDDVKALARPTLRHRIALRPEAQIEGVTAGRRARRGARHRAGPPLAVFLTGRTPLVAAIFVVVAFGWPDGGATVGLFLLALVALVAVDTLLAGAPGRCATPAPATRAGVWASRSGRPHRRPTPASAGYGRWYATRGRPAPAHRPRTYKVVVPVGERRRLDGTLVATRRGDRLADRVTTRSSAHWAWPDGRHGRRFRAGDACCPPFSSRGFLPERLARLRQLDGLVAARVRGQGTEFDSLREYVPGDDVRSIDWRATARGGGVAVRTWRPERDRRILIVLDTSRVSAGRVGDMPRLDAAIDASLLLTALPPGPATGWGCSPSTAPYGRAYAGRRPQTRCPRSSPR